MSTSGESANLDLFAFKFSLANTANPLVIERVPSPESITRTQERQSIIKVNVRSHNKKTFCSLH